MSTILTVSPAEADAGKVTITAEAEQSTKSLSPFVAVLLPLIGIQPSLSVV